MRKHALLQALVVLGLLLLSVPSWAARIFTVGVETNNLSATSTTEFSTSSSGTPAVVTSPVHSGTYALRCNASSGSCWQRITQTGATTGEYWTRFYWRVASLPATAVRFYTNASTTTGTDNHYLTVDSSGTVVLTNVPTSGTITATTQVVAGQWYAIGIHHLLSDTVGKLDLQIDCSAEGTPITTGDTLNTNVGRWFLGNTVSGTIDNYYDDIVVNDATGSAPFNTWSACPANLHMLEPASDSSVVWTKTGANCSGTTNTDCVDDEPGTPDDLSGYNRVTTTGQIDRFNLTTFSGGPDSDDKIDTLYLNGRTGGAATTGTNSGDLVIWDDGGTKHAGPSVALYDVNGWRDPADPTCGGCGYKYAYDISSSKTPAQIESFDIGYETTGTINSSTGANATSLWLYVEWHSFTGGACTAGLNLPLLGVGGCP